MAQGKLVAKQIAFFGVLVLLEFGHQRSLVLRSSMV
jgi:hypothetical protein